MKLNDKMRYPHPVLSEFSSDYSSGELSVAFSHQQTDDNQIKIISNISVRNPEISSLLSTQKAASGYFIVSRRAYFNHLQEVPVGRAEKFFDISRLYGQVKIRPVVWTLTELSDFTSSLINDEYCNSIYIAKGSIIAIGPEFEFSIDPKKFKPFETIFRLAVNERVPPGMIEVSIEEDKILVLAERHTHDSLVNLRNSKYTSSVMLSAVYLPVIVDIVASIKAGEKEHESKRWFQVFKAKCDDLEIELNNPSISPLRFAQMLLKAPLRETIMALGTK